MLEIDAIFAQLAGDAPLPWVVSIPRPAPLFPRKIGGRGEVLAVGVLGGVVRQFVGRHQQHIVRGRRQHRVERVGSVAQHQITSLPGARLFLGHRSSSSFGFDQRLK